MEFPDPARQQTNAVHVSGLPIGTPTKDSPFAGMGTFIPHVIVRNMLSSPQTTAITIEYPDSASAALVRQGDKEFDGESGESVGQFALAPLAVGPDSTVDFSLGSVLGQLPLPLAYCSIRVQYSGPPGSLLAQAASVEEESDLVIDARPMNEGDGWAGSGANPWHLDGKTESVQFLTNMGDKPVRIGFQATANGVHNYLTRLSLAPHETRAISLRKLRDTQQADFKGDKIDASATDGSINWVRLDDVPVMGRLLVIQRQKGVASSYDCCTCPCPASYNAFTMSPSTSFDMLPSTTMDCTCLETLMNCNNVPSYYYETDWATWASTNTSVAYMDSTVSNRVHAQSGGSATISAKMTAYTYYFDGKTCATHTVNAGTSSLCNVRIPYMLQGGNPATQTVCSGKSCQLAITYQVLDVNGIAIHVQGMSVAEASGFASGSVCTGNYNDAGKWTTDSTGTMTSPDYWWWCCTNGTCSFEFTQTFTVSGYDIPVIKYNGYTGSHNIVTIQCSSTNVSTCPAVVPTP
jgi:hypothetical protein